MLCFYQTAQHSFLRDHQGSHAGPGPSWALGTQLPVLSAVAEDSTEAAHHAESNNGRVCLSLGGPQRSPGMSSVGAGSHERRCAGRTPRTRGHQLTADQG